MITTTVVFDSDKEIAAWVADDGHHELRVIKNPDAIINEPTKGIGPQFSDPALILKFTSKASVDSVIARLQSVSAAF